MKILNIFLSLAKQILDPDRISLKIGIRIRIKTFWSATLLEKIKMFEKSLPFRFN